MVLVLLLLLLLLLRTVYINCPLAAGRNFRSQDPAKHPILLCFDPSRSHKASVTSSPDESINTLSALLYVICLHRIEPLKKKKKYMENYTSKIHRNYV